MDAYIPRRNKMNPTLSTPVVAAGAGIAAITAQAIGELTPPASAISTTYGFLSTGAVIATVIWLLARESKARQDEAKERGAEREAENKAREVMYQKRLEADLAMSSSLAAMAKAIEDTSRVTKELGHSLEKMAESSDALREQVEGRPCQAMVQAMAKKKD